MAESDDEVEWLATAPSPRPGEQLWSREPGRAVAKSRPRAPAPAVAYEAPKRDLAEGVGDLIADEVALVHPMLEHVVAPITGEPISQAIGALALALELIELTKEPSAISRPALVPAGPALGQTWGPGGPSASAPKCCRDAAADGRPGGCRLHPSPTMGW